MDTNRHVIAALVQNEPGVLAHVAGMFAARGFNIDSLVVGRTENPEFSRMTIVLSGDDAVLEQVRKQLQKIVEVVRVVDYKDIDYVERDLMMLRVSSSSDSRREIIELTDLFRGQIVDVGRAELMIKITGTEDKLEAFIDLLQPYGIIELARTGVIAMPRSEKVEGKTPTARRRALTAAVEEQRPAGLDPGDLPPG
jgi:acetolactate synthase-1/3 small subunit